MIFPSNVHTHCTWCDGENTPKEMADAAISFGFSDLGFSSHSPTTFDESCLGIKNEADYRADIAALREEYEGKLNILCGVEQDFYAPVNSSDYDYVIGSVHYLPDGKGGLCSVDNTLQYTQNLIRGAYGGNVYAMLEDFYKTTVESAQKYKPDIVGHFDLVKKFNSGNILFNAEDPAVQKLELEALDAVMKILSDYGGIIEVNTGGMGKGYVKSPYPADYLLKRAAEKKARIIITADSHKTATLNFAFNETLARLKGCGFKSMVVLKNSVFEEIKI